MRYVGEICCLRSVTDWFEFSVLSICPSAIQQIRRCWDTFCAIQSGDAANGADATFTKLTGRSPQLSLSTASYRACLSLSEWDKVGHDAASGISVVLHGEIYHAVDHPANYLAQQFANHGFAWAKEIHGSFAILAVDKSADQIVLITDRLNSRRVFASQIEGGICISSHLSAQPWESYELDPTGVASYIVNRALYNSRTLFRGVSVLQCACIHQLTARGFDAAPYWRDGFDSSPKRANQRQLAAELKTRLIQAMRRRLHDSPNVSYRSARATTLRHCWGFSRTTCAFPMCDVSRMTTGRRRPTAMQVWHDKWPSAPDTLTKSWRLTTGTS